MPAEQEFDPQSHLCFEDIRVDNRASPSLIQVTIKASKTDPFRHGGCSPRPLFVWEDKRFLPKDRFVASLRAALSAAGYAAKDYAGHSFRIGAATTAARQGVQDSLIKMLGRWESAAYTRYIQTAPDVLCRVAKTLEGAGDQSQS